MLPWRWVLHHVSLSVPPISWQAIVAAFFLLAICAFDSFGIDQQADDQSARTIGQLEAPFYGMGDGRVGQKAVTVVLIDNQSLRLQDWTVPLSYEDQSLLVGAIANYDPAGIFLDFSYTWPHGDDPRAEVKNFADDLKASARREHGADIAIMIGEVGGQTQEDAFTLLPLHEIQSVGVSWNSNTWTTYPFRANVTGSPYQAVAEVHGPRQFSGHVGANVSTPMAAVALYKAWCARQDELGDKDACRAGWTPPLDDQLFVTWGFGASQASKRFVAPDDARCVMPDDSFGTRLMQALKKGLDAMFRAARSNDGNDAIETRCVYTDTISASQLLNASAQDEDAIRNLIKDRVVLVGAAHSFTDDYHIIPHVGRVPGVLIHAMAVDNLITEQDRYTRPSPLVFSNLNLEWADVIEQILTIVLIMIMWRSHVAALEARKAGGNSIALLWGALVGLGVVIASVCLVWFVLHWAPINAFAVAALVGSLAILFEQHSERVAASKPAG
jgi:CHASE2 domain-containing sensor protein